MYMTFVAKSLSYLNVLLSSSAMAKNIFCFCGYKGAVVESEPERKIKVIDTGSAPVPNTDINEVEGEDLPNPIPRSISMATITNVDGMPFPTEVTSRTPTPISTNGNNGIVSADRVSNSSSLKTAVEESEENTAQNQ